MFHIIAPRLTACSSLGRGAVRWVGLSAPVVALSCANAIYLLWLVCPSCWRSAVSVLLEAPHSGEAPAQQDTNHNTARSHPLVETEKQADNCAHSNRRPWPLLSLITAPTSSHMSYFGRFICCMHAQIKFFCVLYSRCDLIVEIVFFLLRLHI